MREPVWGGVGITYAIAAAALHHRSGIRDRAEMWTDCAVALCDWLGATRTDELLVLIAEFGEHPHGAL